MKTKLFILSALLYTLCITSCNPEILMDNANAPQGCCDDGEILPPPPPPNGDLENNG